MGPVMSIPPSYKVTSQTVKNMLPTLLHRLNNACRKKKKKERKRNKGRVLVNHRGSDKALKLKEIYRQSGMEINNILLTERPPREIGEA